MSAVINPTNIVFAKGYLFGTRQGGTSDDIPFGELQNIEVSSQYTLEELMGPGQLTAIAVGIKEHKVTGNAEYAKLRMRQYYMARGGTAPAYSSSTTYNIGVNSEPVVFNLHLKTPSDGSEYELILYGCICTTMDLKLALNNFSQGKFAFNVYGDGTNVMRIVLPGDQTTS
jgi:hypothetical protein